MLPIANGMTRHEKAFVEALNDIPNKPTFSTRIDDVIWLKTNESNTEEVRQEIINSAKIVNGVFFGVSTLSTMSLIPISKARFAILFDFEEKVVKLNRFMVQNLKDAPSRSKMKEILREYVSQLKHVKIIGQSILEDTNEEIESPFSNEKDYQYLIDMAKEGRIVCIQGSLYDPKIIDRISVTVKNYGLSFSLTYFSNVFETISDYQGYCLLTRNFMRLVESQSLVIDSAMPSVSEMLRFLHIGSQYKPYLTIYVMSGEWEKAMLVERNLIREGNETNLVVKNALKDIDNWNSKTSSLKMRRKEKFTHLKINCEHDYEFSTLNIWITDERGRHKNMEGYDIFLKKEFQHI